MKITLTIRSGEKFNRGLALVKKMGAKFDPSSKGWVANKAAVLDFATSCKFDHETPENYLRRNGLETSSLLTNEIPAALQYRGQASMDDENSIF